MIFNKRIGCKHIGANLATPFNIFSAHQRMESNFVLRALSSRANKWFFSIAIRRFFIGKLATFSLTGDNYPTWNMGNSNRGFDFVNVLPTRAPER